MMKTLAPWTLLRRYGVLGAWRLAIDLCATKIRFRGARLIRQPAHFRNPHLVRIGPGFLAGVGLRIDAIGEDDGNVRVHIGANVNMNDYIHIAAARSVRIGDNVLVASKVFISDHGHGRYSGPDEHDPPDVAPIDRPLQVSPVTIEDNVWIGEFVSILPGVTIGRGSIIGSMSVVTRDIPPGSIAVGAPARVVKRYDAESRRWEPV
jgi:lipopolysaccharide O-acetyltransferase